ncbi:TPA: hypothetical protein HA244_00250 [Candidatus Micrarchaeota archaeon]|nr:hypothetical protein [Candidatus Micrarchaeota archaeon]
MILALLFLASSLALGLAAARFFTILDSLAKKVSIGFLAGFALQTFFILAVSWAMGGLQPPVIFVSSILFFALAFLLYSFPPGKTGRKIRFSHPLQVSTSEIAALAFSLLYLLLMLSAVLRPTPAGVGSVISVWGDYSLHMAITNSFAFAGNFPPQYPVLVGEPLKYSFAMDFASAVLIQGGFDYRSAFLIPNLLVFIALSMAMVVLVELVAGKKRPLVVALAMLLFFVNGNYGISTALGDAFNQQSLSPLLSPARNYSNIDSQAIVLMNWVYSMFLPSRGALFGFALAVVVYALLFSSVLNGEWRKRELFAAGVLTGLFPLAYAYSLLAVGIVAAFLFAAGFWRERKLRGEWLYFAIPAAILLMPQIAWLWGRTIFSWHGGWLSPDKSALGIIDFWLKNGWAVMLCFIAWAYLEFFEGRRKLLVFAAPFAFMFLLGNLVLFQPWDWDNSKLFLHVFFFASIASALFLSDLFNRTRNKELSKTLVAGLVLLAVASGVLALFWTAWGLNARFVMFNENDFAVGDWIKGNTPANALFLTSQDHLNPVASLAGRQIIAGYEGWLWSHGLNYSRKQADGKAMFEKGDCKLMAEYGVSFVFVKAGENATVFEGENFTSIYRDSLGNEIFQSKCKA